MKRKRIRKNKRKDNSISMEIKKEVKELEKDIQDVERWIIERRKFFIKLAWVVGLIVVLIIISHIYLRVVGAGV